MKVILLLFVCSADCVVIDTLEEFLTMTECQRQTTSIISEFRKTDPRKSNHYYAECRYKTDDFDLREIPSGFEA
jgi:hypothetical protein